MDEIRLALEWLVPDKHEELRHDAMDTVELRVEVLPREAEEAAISELMGIAADSELPSRHETRGHSDTVGPVFWEVICFTVSNAAFWTALAATIKAFIARNRDKKVVIKKSPYMLSGVEITGYSEAEIKVLLQAIADANKHVYEDRSNSDSSQPDDPMPLPPSS